MTKLNLPPSAISLFITKLNNEIDLNVQSSETLMTGTIVQVNSNKILIDFKLKSLVEISITNGIHILSNMYLINRKSYLGTNKNSKSPLSKLKKDLNIWLANKLVVGEIIQLKLNMIDSSKNLIIPDLKATINLIKSTQLFHELDRIKQKDLRIKGVIINSIKGGFSVAIGNLIAFLPSKELTKLPTRKPFANFMNVAMYFHIAKINFDRKNIILKRA